MSKTLSTLPTFFQGGEAMRTATGQHRYKHSIRAVFRGCAFLCLLVVFTGCSFLFGPVSNTQQQHDSVNMSLRDDDHRSLQIFQKKADPVGLIAVYILGVIYMFLALAIVCDEYFVPALEEMSSERHLNLSMDVSGATLMAAGGSAPELFTSLIGTFRESDVGFGTIVGSAVFNVLFVIGMCSMLSKEVLSLTWWPLFRDSSYYAIGLITLACFVGIHSKGQIDLWEAIVLFVMYFGYILIMMYNQTIYHKLTGNNLYQDEDENDGHFLMPSSFRAGILKLLRDPDSWAETASVGLVAQMAGDVDDVFKTIDTSGDGTIDRSELGVLFEKLDVNISDEELNNVFTELDISGDGAIDQKEFKIWYIRSEERIKEKTRNIFDQFDTDHSNTIEKPELMKLLAMVEPRVTPEDVDLAVAACYKEGSKDEITFEEFSEWYLNSLIYEKQTQAIVAEEEEETLCDSLKPPSGVVPFLQWLFLLPLVATLAFTIPDTRKNGMGRWCYFSFVISICWIGVYSYFMVGWAETIGETVGIPTYIMGLTFLAAGTSVPDLLSSVIVARRGQGDMAVSSSIGSNIFDILVGLPVPWILYTAWPDKPSTVTIGADGVWMSIFILLVMLVLIIGSIHLQGWKLTKTLGCFMFFFYFLFLLQAILTEYLF